MKKRSALATVFTFLSLILGVAGVLCLTLLLIGFFIVTDYRSSPWFWAIARITVSFPFKLVLQVLLGSSLILGLLAVVTAWLKHARKGLPVTALALAGIEIGAILIASSRFAQHSPLYSAYLNFISSAPQQNRAYTKTVTAYRTTTPLHQAAEAGKVEEVRRLLREGADPFEKCAPGWTAGGLAIKNGHYETVQALIEESPKVANDKDYLGGLLHVCVGQNNLQIAKLLIDNGANLDVTTPDGWTPLMNAAQKGHEEIAELLIDKGANVDPLHPEGLGPLMVATYWGRMNLVTKLLDNGANINVRTFEGATPLMSACSVGNTEMVDLLISRGADLNIRDKNGHTAMAWAAHGGYIDLVRSLQQIGAKE